MRRLLVFLGASGVFADDLNSIEHVVLWMQENRVSFDANPGVYIIHILTQRTLRLFFCSNPTKNPPTHSRLIFIMEQ
jgi:hypothetical protein